MNREPSDRGVLHRSDLYKKKHIITFCGNAKCSHDDPVMLFCVKMVYETLLLLVFTTIVKLSV